MASDDVKYRIRESEYDALVAERDHFKRAWAELNDWKEKDSFVTLATVGFLQSLVRELCDQNTESGQQVAQLQAEVERLHNRR